MKYFWERPLTDSQPYPLIYSVFDASDSKNNKLTFRVEDLSEDRFEEAIELMRKNYLAVDPMLKSKGILNDDISVMEIVDDWMAILKQKISIACYKEDSNEIIGVSFLSVMSEKEFDWKPKGEIYSELKKVSRFIKDIFFNPFEHFKVEQILFAAGHYITENYKESNIESEMIKARDDIGKYFDIHVSSNLISTVISQNAAASNGYEENFSINYKKLPKLLYEGYFPGIKEDNLKVMSKKFY